MILALDKHAALYIFSSTKEAERELEAIDVQQGEFEFCDSNGQRYSITYSVPPKMSRLGAVEIGAFKLGAAGQIDPALPLGFIERAAHVEHTSISELATIQALKDILRKGA